MNGERRVSQTTFHQAERGNGFSKVALVLFFGTLSGTLGYLGYPELCALTGVISIGFALKEISSKSRNNMRDKFLK